MLNPKTGLLMTPQLSDDSLMTLYGLKQLITEPTHTLEHSPSCIHLTFTNQPNLIMDSGIHPTLNPKCHHQIIYSKLNLKIEYPPPYTCEIWDYNRTKTDLINRFIESFDKDVHKQVILFNKLILNIFHNFIPNKLIICDDIDPPWMNDGIKTLIKRKNWLHQRHRRSGNLDYNMLNTITTDISNAVNSSKLEYHDHLAKKLHKPKIP